MLPLFCGDQTSQHLYVLRHLRDRFPDDKVISYTFPSSALDFPFSDGLRFGHPYVDYFTAYRASEEDVQDAVDMGVSKGERRGKG